MNVTCAACGTAGETSDAYCMSCGARLGAAAEGTVNVPSPPPARRGPSGIVVVAIVLACLVPLVVLVAGGTMFLYVARDVARPAIYYDASGSTAAKQEDAVRILDARLRASGRRGTVVGNGDRIEVRLSSVENDDLPALDRLLRAPGVLEIGVSLPDEYRHVVATMDILQKPYPSVALRPDGALVVKTQGREPAPIRGEFDILFEMLDAETARVWSVDPSQTISPVRIEGAEATNDPHNGWIVSMTLTSASADSLGDLTAKSVGRTMVIALDGMVRSAPVIQSEVSGRNVQITIGGPHTESDAREMAAALGTEPLPFELPEPTFPERR